MANCPDCNAPEGRLHASHCPQRLAGNTGPVGGQPPGSGTSLVPVAMSHAGIQLSSLQDALEFAKQLVESGAAPKGMRPGAVVGIIQAGAEVNCKPMQSLANFSAINGRIGPMTKLAKSLIRQAGVLKAGSRIEEWIEVDGEKVAILPNDFREKQTIAYCRSQRADEEEAVTHVFSWADAVRAGLASKEGPWKEYPQRQLMHRARGFHFDDQYGDVLLGFTIAEALEDYPSQQRDLRKIPAEAASIEDDQIFDGDEDSGDAADVILGGKEVEPEMEGRVIDASFENGSPEAGFGPEAQTERDQVSEPPDDQSAAQPETAASPDGEAPGPGPDAGDEKPAKRGGDQFVPPECHYCNKDITGEVKTWRGKNYHPEHTPTALRKAMKQQEAQQQEPAAGENWDDENTEATITEQDLEGLERLIKARADKFIPGIPAAESFRRQLVAKANEALKKEGKFAIAEVSELPVRFLEKARGFLVNAKFKKLEEIDGN